MGLTYKDSGVDIKKGDDLVEKIKTKVKATYGDRVKSGVGGFACLYEVGDRFLAAGTDGVGTKLKLAIEMGIHNTVGIDLVAMCVNDILCTGAKPLFFMDYLATGSLQLGVSEKILDGIVEGCLQSEAALIGGETAEMPGMYAEGDYDLAGFAVGEVFPDDLLDGSKIKEGQTLIGLKSSGFHSNGYSLIRKVFQKKSPTNKSLFLTPTKIYWKATKNLLEKKLVTGMAHITGGGLSNISRMNSSFSYQVEYSLEEWKSSFFSSEMNWLQEAGDIDTREMLTTFNGGIGLVICTESPDKLLKELEAVGEEGVFLGKVASGEGVVLRDARF